MTNRKIKLKKIQTKNQSIDALEERLMNKSLEGKCPICRKQIRKDFTTIKHDYICKECLNDWKEIITLQSDMTTKDLPKWIITPDYNTMRKMIIVNNIRKDFPDKYEQTINDFAESKLDKEINHELVMDKYNELKLLHPEWNERKLLEEAFNNMKERGK